MLALFIVPNHFQRLALFRRELQIDGGKLLFHLQPRPSRPALFDERFKAFGLFVVVCPRKHRADILPVNVFS
jgi:hypothetical protein